MSTASRPSVVGSDRVPWNQLIAYGMGGLIPIALFNIAGQLMGLLGNISLGLSAVWLGAIMIVPRLWEALSDPVIGHFSDNTRTRWGRRRPYLLVGGLAVAATFVAMWWVPRGDWIREIFPGDIAFGRFQLAYILAGLLLFFTACAVFEIPHGALGLEMSADPHERTRLFSAKSFLGNLFAMGTPWLIALADRFSGTGGDLVDGMRYVTIFVALALVPMTFWWFLSLREPGFAVAKEQKKSAFWHDMRTTVSNKTFLLLTIIVFTLAMGFNFVSNFAYYITIFYLYGGDVTSAGLLLGVTGTVWAVTALVAVFPLNWLSRRFGKRTALLTSILLMCAAQLAKIVCYRQGTLFQFALPEWLSRASAWLFSEPLGTVTVDAPYLILIPTMLLSAGMLMFFTLGASMVGDVCDEDELKTGTRSEGTYYSVFWWFIKMGTAFASLVGGLLLAFTAFDERQNITADALQRSIALIQATARDWQGDIGPVEDRAAELQRLSNETLKQVDALRLHISERAAKTADQRDHFDQLLSRADVFRTRVTHLRTNSSALAGSPDEVLRETDELHLAAAFFKQQTPQTLFRLRLVEIGLPLALSCVSIVLTLRYPLSEARLYEIKAALQQRHAEQLG
jgi:GPH family glycoside/pentoside/hexuronide:cation symporter